ncbi:MAG: EAL domain-containing protein [Lachnospiraceae bacterium]|nr:EAL domain-containing protein [Lachnospiraceae bacterium]
MHFSDTLELLNSVCDAINTTSDNHYVFISNIETDVSRWSKNAVDYFGLPSETMIAAGDIWAEHIHPEDRESYKKSIEDIFSGNADSHIMDYRAKNKEGVYVTCSCDGRVIKDDDGKDAFFIGTISNHGIQTNYDPTTGLPNQYKFFKELKKRIEEKNPFTLVLFSIRDFSEINTLYGYSFGNQVLKSVADKLTEMNLKLSNSFRLDGLRFGILVDGISIQKLNEQHDKFAEILRTDIVISGVTIPLRAASGALLVDNFETDELMLYSNSRYALDLSKQKRHGELVVIHNSSEDKSKNTLKLMKAIKTSITHDCEGFFLTYQPIVDAETEKLTGMEALLRWKHDDFGVVPPNSFLPWLELDDAFVEVGNWIFRESFSQTRDLVITHPELILNVNIAYTQLERSDFRSSFVNILQETGFPPENLCIELTERCRLLDMDFLRNEIIFLKSLGIKVALDDFGTGFSSLSLLKVLPVDIIKIDRAFIMDIEKNTIDQQIIDAITNCAKNIKLNVCVEGIETTEMRDFLKHYYTTSFQGYYYSRPVKLSDFKELTLYKLLA